MAKEFLTPNDLFMDSYKLARKIYDDGFRPDFVVGIWRGGTPIGIAVGAPRWCASHVASAPLTARPRARAQMEEYFRIQACPIKYHTAIKTESYTGIGQRRDVKVFGLEDIVSRANSEDKLLLIDDVFDTGNSVKAVLERLKAMCRKNTPEIRTACLYYKPKANQTDIVPSYWLRETEAWLVFPHEVGRAVPNPRSAPPSSASVASCAHATCPRPAFAVSRAARGADPGGDRPEVGRQDHRDHQGAGWAV